MKEERLAYDAPEIIQDHFSKAKIEIVRKLKLSDMGTGDGIKCSWYYCDLPDSEKDAEQLVNRIFNSYFLKMMFLINQGQLKKVQAIYNMAHRILEKLRQD